MPWELVVVVIIVAIGVFLYVKNRWMKRPIHKGKIMNNMTKRSHDATINTKGYDDRK